MPTKQTGFGLVDREALERLRNECDTMQILRDNIVAGRVSDVVDIHELVEVVDSGGFDPIKAGEAIQSCCEPLRALDSEECLAGREGWAD